MACKDCTGGFSGHMNQVLGLYTGKNPVNRMLAQSKYSCVGEKSPCEKKVKICDPIYIRCPREVKPKPRICITCEPDWSKMGPSPYCIWDIPEEFCWSPCGDWRRYDEDLVFENKLTGCISEPMCHPPRNNQKYPPYLGQKFGPRYMGWSYSSKFFHPRTFESPLSKC